MNEFKPTHVYDGRDTACYYFEKGESVQYLHEYTELDGMELSIYENENGEQQIVQESCMTSLVENAKESL